MFEERGLVILVAKVSVHRAAANPEALSRSNENRVALQWPGSEMSHVTGKHEMFLYMYHGISMS
jgi:hypothetical protein